MIRLRRLAPRDRWGICFGLLLGLGLLAAGPQVLACCQNGECAFETCCYSHNTCMDAGNEYRRCVTVYLNPWFCYAGDLCSGEECDLE
jgi:hypothetical protein